MSTTQDFLVEIGCEELPPKSLKALSQAFEHNLAQALTQAQLGFTATQAFATPRRLAVKVSALCGHQKPQRSERKGPALSVAFDAQGQPTRAAEGFARSLGLKVSELKTLETDQGAWLYHEIQQAGQSAIDLLPSLVASALQQLPITKPMRWGSSRETFIRPVHWVLMIFGNTLVPATILGQTSGHHSFGHRDLSQGPIIIHTPDEYETKLKSAKVMACFEKRRAFIKEQLLKTAINHQAEIIINEALLEEVTALVEWPVILSATFDSQFLEVPAEALMASMQEHQKYFPLIEASAAKKLLPKFIFVSNLESQDPQSIISGNEKVIRPRLADAAFFWQTDKKTTLAARVPHLDNIIFQKQLGSLLDKTKRIQAIAVWLAQTCHQETAQMARAAWLCKADLTSQMVLEFAHMQGIAGYYYAQQDGENPIVCTAMKEHYLPRHSGDHLPLSFEGQCLAIADRLDTLVGIFGIGQPPTGSKDPFALRRAALSILRILVTAQLDLDLKPTLEIVINGYNNQNIVLPKSEGLAQRVLDYVLDRFDASYHKQKIAPDIFLAVRAQGQSRPFDIDQRTQALRHFCQTPEALALCSVAKRVNNLLEKCKTIALPTVDTQHFELQAEETLYTALTHLEHTIPPLLMHKKYNESFILLANLKTPVDDFFNSVLVMDDRTTHRHNRLALLAQLQRLFTSIADLSQLQFDDNR